MISMLINVLEIANAPQNLTPKNSTYYFIKCDTNKYKEKTLLGSQKFLTDYAMINETLEQN